MEVKAHQLLKVSGQLLLRVSESSRESAANHADGYHNSVTLTSQVRERLEQLEFFGWGELLSGLLKEVEGAHTPAISQPGGSAQAAACLRGAADGD